MRMNAIGGAAALALTPLLAQATVETGHWQVQAITNTAQGSNTTISIDQTAAGDITSTLWSYNAGTGTLTFRSLTVDEGSSLYLVQPGDIVSQDMVLNPGAHSLSSTQGVKVGTDFWLGGATSSLSDPGVTWQNVNTRTSFGWAHFQAQTDGTLKILSSAMAFREGGIVVGSLQAVPEPGTWLLMGLGLVGVGLAAHRRHAA